MSSDDHMLEPNFSFDDLSHGHQDPSNMSQLPATWQRCGGKA